MVIGLRSQAQKDIIMAQVQIKPPVALAEADIILNQFFGSKNYHGTSRKALSWGEGPNGVHYQIQGIYTHTSLLCSKQEFLQGVNDSLLKEYEDSIEASTVEHTIDSIKVNTWYGSEQDHSYFAYTWNDGPEGVAYAILGKDIVPVCCSKEDFVNMVNASIAAGSERDSSADVTLNG